MGFERYQHVEKVFTQATDGLLYGKVVVFPKVDGSNVSLWCEDGMIKAGSRNLELSPTNTNQGFYEHAQAHLGVKRFFEDYPNYRLFAEWLVPHTLRTYRDDAWRKFYVFDVLDEDGNYIPYDNYSKILDNYDIEYIIPLAIANSPTEETLLQLVNSNTYLIKDGEGVGEGIVCKNYEYANKYGKITWGKIVRNDFKEKNRKIMGVPEYNSKGDIENEIIKNVVTHALVNKEKAKIENANDGYFESKHIGELIKTVWYCVLSEELPEQIHRLHLPKIDFKRLNKLCAVETKSILGL